MMACFVQTPVCEPGYASKRAWRPSGQATTLRNLSNGQSKWKAGIRRGNEAKKLRVDKEDGGVV